MAGTVLAGDVVPLPLQAAKSPQIGTHIQPERTSA